MIPRRQAFKVSREKLSLQPYAIVHQCYYNGEKFCPCKGAIPSPPMSDYEFRRRVERPNGA